LNRKNRFFDKPFQLVVTQNGKAGINGEHSLMDGQPLGSLWDWLIKNEVNPEVHKITQDNRSLSEPQMLRWELTTNQFSALSKAWENYNKLVDNCNHTAWNFELFGKQILSKNLKTSPDAACQLALQLAYYRQLKQFCGVYESVSMRHYKRGRTETGRCLTKESKAWVLSMDDSSKTKAEKIELYKKAANRHIEYINEAKAGKGIDRHLLALQQLTVEAGEPLHPLFSTEAYKRSKTWLLSTSHLIFPSTQSIGFGPVEPDGYGICYGVKKNHIHIHLTSWRTSSYTDLQDFRNKLIQALIDIQSLLSNPSKL